MIQYQAMGAKTDELFSALADPTRRRLLEYLDDGPASVSTLAEPFDMTLTAIGQHLRVLEAAGLISTEKVGRQRICALDQTALATAQEWIEQRRSHWHGRLDRLADHLDTSEEPQGSMTMPVSTAEVVHDTIVLERHLAHPPEVVLEAYADLDQRVAWSVPSDDEVIIYESADFTVGGTDRFLCGPREQPNFAGTTEYHHIDGSSFVFTERLVDDSKALLAVSLVTWQINATPTGCTLVVTDQVTSTAGQGPIDGSRDGYGAVLDNLVRMLDAR